LTVAVHFLCHNNGSSKRKRYCVIGREIVQFQPWREIGHFSTSIVHEWVDRWSKMLKEDVQKDAVKCWIDWVLDIAGSFPIANGL